MADQVHVIQSSSDWAAKLQEASKNKLIVVDFTATWCGPCKAIAPHFERLSKDYPNVIFLKVDVDRLPDVSSQWKVRAMPTFIFIKDGKQIDIIVGANKEELEAKVARHSL
ncbi:hypothetical protein O6H91_23G069100 [Diphasiastrum complanatum]|uniref:Uncharacterized protein n=1 Tax=Diphasiastrum complanatum TaxID=34168 RepID=A0ACC2ABQ7_DIPCM|nr:hypothetical protein O6H91_23G069100 [Diphasiastrum complanatum]